MRRKWLAGVGKWIIILMIAAAPATARAADDDAEDMYDARLEGYGGNVTLPQKSSGLTWVLFVVLAVVAAGGLFKDAKRSHLD